MGFLCMSPNGPLYGQNVWAMRIYASSSYLDPRCFTPTNSPPCLHSPECSKEDFWMSEFFPFGILHSFPPWLGQPSRKCNSTGFHGLRGEIKRGNRMMALQQMEEAELKMRPQGIVRWVSITLSGWRWKQPFMVEKVKVNSIRKSESENWTYDKKWKWVMNSEHHN